ncbi:MAG: hypothetical protein AB1449_11585, partial [Chloroflexota bacterium]
MVNSRTRLGAAAAALATAAALLLVWPALADYLGPNRTVTTWVWRRLRCHYEAVYDPPGTGWYGCTLDLYDTPDSSCPSSSEVVGYFTPSACSWAQAYCQVYGCSISRSSSVGSCNEGETGCRGVEETVTHPEATVSASVSCAVPGNSGWCRGGAEVSLSGSEPLAGYSILALEGTRNGETFACPGSSCSVPLLEGINDFTFWALSSWGDSSRMATASGRLDSGPPSISGEVIGTAGEAGWYVSKVTVTASAADAVSGLVGFEVSLDGDGWAPYSGPVTVSDGEHTVELRAMDAAGNYASQSLEVRVHTQPPDLALGAGGSFCPGCGESMDIALDVQDGGTGVAEWTLSVDGIGITSGNGPASEAFAWDGSGFGAGAHTLTLSARDIVGNAAEASVSVQLVAPTAVPPTSTTSQAEAQASVVASDPPAATESSGAPTRTPPPTRTPVVSQFGGMPAVPLVVEGKPPDETEPSLEDEPAGTTAGPSSHVLWGGAAVALIGAATAAALEAAQRSKEDEARLKAEMARKNAEAEAREAEVRRNAGLARLAALAAAAAAAARETRDRLFERGEFPGEAEEMAARAAAEAREQREASLRGAASPLDGVTLAQSDASQVIEPCAADRLPADFRPPDLVWFLRNLPEVRDRPLRVRVPLVRQILPYGILTVGKVTTTLISTYQNPNIWLGVDAASGGARAGMPQASVAWSNEGYTVGIRWPVGALAYPSIPGPGNPEIYSITRAYSAYIHFQPRGFWNSTLTVDLNFLDMSTAAAVNTGRKLGHFHRLKSRPLGTSSQGRLGTGLGSVVRELLVPQ